MADTHVAALCGSLRDESYTRAALGVALDAAADLGATTDLVDLRDVEMPVYGRADEDDPGDVAEMRRRIRSADAIVLGTPMYHGSYASPLKTAIDYCGFDEFEGRTVGLLAVSGGSFPSPALDHLRIVCRALDAWVLPFQAAVPNSRENFDGRDVVDDDLRERVAVLGRRVVQYADIHPDPGSLESDQNVGAT